MKTTFDMERSISRARVVLSLIAILALYIDPTEPTLTRWLPLTGGAFTINRYWATVLFAHLSYSLTLAFLQARPLASPARLAAVATYGDVLFAAAIALVTEGTTSPFYAFFTFAVLSVGLRSGLRSALTVTAVSVVLYGLLVVSSAPHQQGYYIIMRAAYIAITGYLVGFLGQERLTQEKRIRELEADAQRERIARSLHDGYAQSLASVNVRLGTCRELLLRGQQSEVLTELADIRTGVDREQADLRTYIRSLVDLGLDERATNHPRGTAVSLRADVRGSSERLEHVLLLMLEGMRNIRRHAGATSAAIAARNVDGEIRLTIDDDGVGFPEGTLPPWSMLSRVSECGGRLELVGDAQRGAHLVIELPTA